MKKLLALIIAAVLVLTSCAKSPKYTKYSADFYNLFDVLTTVTVYAENEAEFEKYRDIVKDRLTQLNSYYDIYNDYDGINNVKTINDNAGIKPVEVEQDIIDLLEFSLSLPATNDGGDVNVAFGPVLKIWHNYREEATSDPRKAKVPTQSEFENLASTDRANVVLDKANKTVYLKEKGMSLDVGALAKGYSAQRALEAAKEAGATSVLLNMGGNVAALGKPLEKGRTGWNVGVQDPNDSNEKAPELMDMLAIDNKAVVTSGDYQRFYMVDDKRYNHVIDPKTNMPADKFAAVTVICDDSGVGDFLSTQFFINGIDNPLSQSLIQKYKVEVLVVGHDGKTTTTAGYKDYSEALGAGK